MFLRKFTLSDQLGNTIREVTFKRGMNLILGEPSSSDGKSTNSLGKTTLIRCIDFCLGAKISDIYKDPEFKTDNIKVLDFLNDKKPTFSLEISKKFNSEKKITITRVVDLTASRRKVKSYINDDPILEKNFPNKLKEIFFNFSDEKPTFRQLASKFVRSADHEISKILRFNDNFCSIAEYEKIHLYLLGFESSSLLTKKSDIEQEISKTERILSSLKDRHSQSSLKQKLYILNDEIKELREKRDNFKVNEKYDIEAEKLNSSQIRLGQIDSQLSGLRLKKHINEDRIAKLENDQLSLSSESLKYLYEEANYYNPKLAKTFDELVVFHNSMLDNEKRYLKDSLADVEKSLEILEKSRSKEACTYNKLLSFLGQTGSLAEYTKLNEKISIKAEEIGFDEALLNELTFHENLLAELEDQKKELNLELQGSANFIDSNLAIFNSFFSSYTEKLDNEKYLLAYDITEEGLFKFKVSHLHGNPGAGHKQAVVVAFDLAYMAFCNKLNLDRPLFATIDKVEIIDLKKIRELFLIADEQNGQLIAPFIYDKLESIYSEIKQDVILSLTPNDRFFRIESNTP